jgi:hypothetical protein
MERDAGMLREQGHYDYEGEPMSLLDWTEAFADMDYRRVALDEIGVFNVSTVWLGLDHGLMRYGQHEPIIFETAVFITHPDRIVNFFGRDHVVNAEWLDDFMRRYTNAADAERGHRETCAALEMLDVARAIQEWTAADA